MNRVVCGLICGFVIGVIDVLIMILLSFETRRHKLEALSGAFLERFMTGLIIPNLMVGV